MAGGAFNNAFGFGFDQALLEVTVPITFTSVGVPSAIGALIGVVPLSLFLSPLLTAVGEMSGTINIFFTDVGILASSLLECVSFTGVFNDFKSFTGVFNDSVSFTGKINLP